MRLKQSSRDGDGARWMRGRRVGETRPSCAATRSTTTETAPSTATTRTARQCGVLQWRRVRVRRRRRRKRRAGGSEPTRRASGRVRAYQSGGHRTFRLSSRRRRSQCPRRSCSTSRSRLQRAAGILLGHDREGLPAGFYRRGRRHRRVVERRTRLRARERERHRRRPVRARSSPPSPLRTASTRAASIRRACPMALPVEPPGVTRLTSSPL